MTWGPDRPRGPMKPWPRLGGPDAPDGPLSLSRGPQDHENQGREAFWDQTPDERKAALPAMVHDANLNCASRVGLAYLGEASANKMYARGWLSELERVRNHTRYHAPKK